MSVSCARRLRHELVSLIRDPPEGVSATPIDDTMKVWESVICGPPGTPLEGGVFELSLKFTDEYPFRPPNVKFVSEVFHPNVSKDGRICLDILSDKWSPSMDVRCILISIQSLLVNPDIHSVPEHAANEEAEALYVRDVQAYNSRVRVLVRKQLDTCEISTTEPNSFIGDIDI
jgi:ubiquitin-conjugating enzyme E2 A